MNTPSFARSAGLVCLVESLLQIIYELLALRVARPRRIAVIGATLIVVGSLNRIAVAALIIMFPSQKQLILIVILIGIFLLLLGIRALGITTLLGKQLTGWQAWTPLLIGFFVHSSGDLLDQSVLPLYPSRPVGHSLDAPWLRGFHARCPTGASKAGPGAWSNCGTLNGKREPDIEWKSTEARRRKHQGVTQGSDR